LLENCGSSSKSTGFEDELTKTTGSSSKTTGS
jgi:hypothetical protein